MGVLCEGFWCQSIWTRDIVLGVLVPEHMGQRYCVGGVLHEKQVTGARSTGATVPAKCLMACVIHVPSYCNACDDLHQPQRQCVMDAPLACQPLQRSLNAHNHSACKVRYGCTASPNFQHRSALWSTSSLAPTFMASTFTWNHSARKVLDGLCYPRAFVLQRM